ncbi:hypothetical protein [Croceicoccus gelatinilyticus]|uniref:hypothetical protein n=1 Tax=Croceicoccus gelatinilyticus TaxID=2835536 RepID=UPI001BCB09E2|nr:hypothetical protein [Croceicoccus gelatinilyticus]MBS7668347.1 hypothetical protein [Croceicoccus gelatinilyticus]
MNSIFRSAAGAAALLAASSLAVPVQAAPLPTTSDAPTGIWTIESETAHGWKHHRRWRRNRVDGGDLLAGILILGGVVAIAKAAENAQERKYRERRDEDYRYRDYDRDSRRYDDRRYADNSRRGIDGAIEDCVYEVERSEEVRTVDTAERDERGWHVEGDLANGGRFDCEIDASGRVRDIDIEVGSRRYGSAADAVRPARDSRYGDDYYADARARIEEQAPATRVEDGARPADEGDTWERGTPDDRYQTADGPDYALVG